jgi:23S rRNA (pseudouridine1915-N3)-methyltransferase
VRFLVAVVGRPRHPGLAAAIADYEARAARYWPLDVVEVREEGSRSQGAELVRRREGERLLERVGDLPLVACDEAGETLTSAAFARQLQHWREATRSTAFVIGGAHGLDEAVRKRAVRTLSLAPFTLPHEMARLVLAEQLYRAGTIVRREPYHK